MTTDPSTNGARGRPRDLAKREAILDAALRLFLGRGYDAVTMEQVIAAAGVSRATLYAAHQDKAALLEALIDRESAKIIPDEEGGDLTLSNLSPRLRSVGEHLLQFIYDGRMSGFERLASQAGPELSRRLFAVGPGRSEAAMTRLISRAQAQGLLRAGDPVEAMEDFAGLVQGMAPTNVAYGHQPAFDPDELRQRVERAVAKFLRLHGPDAS